MKAEQVDKALHQKFIIEGERLVFWHDPNEEFADYIGEGLSGDLAEVQVLDIAEEGGLSAKLRLEQDDTEGKYLIYSKGEISRAEEDWLLDIRLYSAEFHADVASLWLQELGLSRLSMRDHLKARAAFMGSLERRKKLKRLMDADDDEATLDLKMMAVLVGSPMANPFDVLRALCHRHVQNDRFDLSTPPTVIATFEKMALLERFWAIMGREFSYTAEEPSVAGLLRKIFISELFHESDDAHMDSIAHHKLPAAGRQNAVVFLTQWRDSSGKSDSYDAAAAAVASEQKVSEPLATLELDTLRDVYTFWEAEKRVVSSLKDRLQGERQSLNVESLTELVSERKAGYWLTGQRRELPDRQAIACAYDAIVAAAGIFELHLEHQHALSFETPEKLLNAYRDKLHRFDRLYRDFCTQAKPALSQGWDLLKTLTEDVERVYDQGFLQPLGIEWSRLLDEGFLDKWSVEELPPQQEFYAKQITPHIKASDRKRAYVIISDAFRYEAAKELTESLNSVYRMDAQLSAMLGVLPSYTALGMASLMPHDVLAFDDKGEVLVDGKTCAGVDARNMLLDSVDGMACQAATLRVKKLEEAREFTQGKRVVYIYHNVIDARGDSAPTEGESFEAVSDCIRELIELVQFCVNRLSAGKVWITADHGFLFQMNRPSETDKSKLNYKPELAVKVKKRYLIGNNLGATPEAHHGSIGVTAGALGSMEFWVPRAANLFHFKGGARFVHGGAMPQEVVVPLVTVTHVRGKHREGTRSEKVSVQVLGGNHKITTPKYRFEIIQTEAVGERRKPITLRGAVYDGANPVTSVETITFDSDSDSIEDRKKSIRLELRTGTYDKSTPYRLVLRDIDSDAEVQSIPVVIDRSFDDDF